MTLNSSWLATTEQPDESIETGCQAGVEPQLIDLPAIRVLFSLLYTSVWLAAVAGNSIVCYVLILNRVSLSVRSVFLCSLALSDLITALTSLPITAITLFSRVWLFPLFACHLIGVIQGGSIFVSSFTLSAIALDRCLLVKKPNKEVISRTFAFAIVVGIWSVGYSLALPTGIFSLAIEYNPGCGYFCDEQWPDMDPETTHSSFRQAYGIGVMFTQFGVPLLMCATCYYLVGRVMAAQIEKRRGHSALLPTAAERLEGRRVRANRMMTAMVLAFFLSWLPLNAANVYRDVFGHADHFDMSTFSLVFAGAHLMAMLSAVANPCIYCWFNPQFRQSITQLLKRADGPATTSSRVQLHHHARQNFQEMDEKEPRTKLSHASPSVF